MLVLKSTYLELKEEYQDFKDKILDTVELETNLKKIHTYKFPKVVEERTKRELNISDKELNLIIIDFFDYMYTVQKYKNVDMLSRTTDVLWHNLILDTKAYFDFCLNYIGFFIHHEPYLTDKKINSVDLIDIQNKYTNANIPSGYRNYRDSQISSYSTTDLSTYLLFYTVIENSNTPQTNSTTENTSRCSSSCRSSCSSSSSCGSSCSSSSSCSS